jgi:hypothetical protein
MLPYRPDDMLSAVRERHGWDDPNHPLNRPLTDEEVEAMIRRRDGSSNRAKTRLAFLGLFLALAFVAVAMGASIVS